MSASGKPKVAILEVDVDAASANIIESKSFKLYLNSFNQTVISTTDLQKRIEDDLSRVSGETVAVRLFDVENYPIHEPVGYRCLDDLAIDCSDYEVNPDLLRFNSGSGVVEEQLKSHLFRSLCPVTSQPDWASIYIAYRGQPIDHGSLLAYLISFRRHQGFHEQCVEMIYDHLLTKFGCEALTVFARFARRGGLDINPIRSTSKLSAQNFTRSARQ